MTTRLDKPFWIGIDVSKASLEAALAPIGMHTADWRKLKVQSFAHTADGAALLALWIAEQADPALCRGLCAESTGPYSQSLARLLRGRGLPELSIVNPARSVQFSRSCGARSKTDRIDAALLAVFGAVHAPAPAPRPSQIESRMRELDRTRQALIQERTSLINRQEQIQDAWLAGQIKSLIQSVNRTIEEIDGKLQEIALEDQKLARQIELLVSIPGIKQVTAVTLTVELGDLSRYSREEIVARAGLFARLFESGSSVRKRARMACGGGARLRRVLYMGATSLYRSKHNPLGEFARALVRAGKSAMCALGALMRKLLLVARAVVRSGKPYDATQARRQTPSQTPKRAPISSTQGAHALP